MGNRRRDNKRHRTVMLQISIIIAVFVIAAALMLVFFLFGGKRKAKKTAKAYMDGIVNRDADMVLEVTDSENQICVAFANAFALDDASVSGFEYEISECSKATDEDTAYVYNLYYDETVKFDKAYVCDVDCIIESAYTGESANTRYELFCYKKDKEWYVLRLR